jgi:hypothetical protein
MELLSCYSGSRIASYSRLPEDELWRVVRFEPRDDGWISWIHEREWRCSGNFKVPSKTLAVLVRDTRDALRLQKQIEEESKEFKCKPSSIIPLSIICQGFLSREEQESK